MYSLVAARAPTPSRVTSRVSRVSKPRARVTVASRAETKKTKSDVSFVPTKLSNHCAALAASLVLLTNPAPVFAKTPPAPTTFVATLVAVKGYEQVSGVITFESALNKSNQEVVFVTPKIVGLPPGAHGMNVHDFDGVVEFGSVGASFNPDGRPHGAPDSITPPAPTTFVATLVAVKGYEQVSGVITFESALNKSNQEVVFVTPKIVGLPPGAHGMNVHDFDGVVEFGSVGASFNPDGRPHGAPDSIKKFGASACHFVGEGCQWNRHAGDLGNVNIGIDAKPIKDTYISLKPGKLTNIVGKAVVVHAFADDFKTEKDDGDAGPVVAFGVIKAV